MTSSTITSQASETAFVREQLKKACRGSLKYSSDYLPRDSALIKRKTLLPLPPSCQPSAAVLDAAGSDERAGASSAKEPTVLTVKTLGGHAYKLHICLQDSTGADLHRAVRSLCAIPETSVIRVLRQGRVIPDAAGHGLAASIPDASVPLNLIEQVASGAAAGGTVLLGDGFWKEFETVLAKHVPDASARSKIRKGLGEHYEQWLKQ